MSRIYISRPPAEWAIIEEKLKRISRSNLGAFVNNRVSLLCKEFEDEPWKFCDFIEKTQQKTFYISEDCYKIISELCIMNDDINESSVVNRLIIEPLLLR